ncbi:MAG: Pyrrolo-quinoline quinone [Nevskia sp.]|nr:Pyrrolo-quinoline quinone [Nevskia sp.]
MKRRLVFLFASRVMVVAAMLWSGFAVASTTLVLSPDSVPPTKTTAASGAGFVGPESVDLYFDSARVATASANAAGTFSDVTLTVPQAATPGVHTIKAIGRSSAATAQAQLTVSTNWLQSGFNGGHTHYNPYENIVGADSVADLTLQWTRTVGGAAGSFLSPVAAHQLIYFAGTHSLYSIHPDTGAGHWSVPLNASGAPVIVHDTIVVVGFDADGISHLAAFDSGSGQPQWSVELSPLGDIAADADAVYVSTGKSLSAYAAATGVLRWQTALPGCSYYYPASGPIVASGKIYVGCYDGNLLAVNAADGALQWSAPVGPIERSPAAQGSLVYVTDVNGKVYAFNTADGSPRWSAQMDSSDFRFSPAVAGDIVYQVSTADTLFAFNKTSGRLLWSVADAGNTNPAIANGVLYLGGGTGIEAYDALSGARLSTPQVQASTVVSDPVIVNGRLYVVDNAASTVVLKAFGLPTGAAQ